jgi:retron-type reverse transcriptase
MVKDAVFPERIYAEPIRILLTMLCYHKDALPQGAPSSPAITNIILYDFDERVGQWCRARSITYTRYCDDMTFSGSFDEKIIEEFVKNELHKMGFFLNEKKTVVAENGRRKTVTGIVVNDKLNVSADYRRKIRQELFYIKKYTLKSHTEKLGTTDTKAYLQSLLGRINYVLSINPNAKDFEGYKNDIIKLV